MVLAIATRLRTERFIVSKINDDAFWHAIAFNQTQKLIVKFKKQFPSGVATIATLDRVALMTPENIHLNSFMYEPIIDMGEDQLRRLYEQAKALT